MVIGEDLIGALERVEYAVERPGKLDRLLDIGINRSEVKRRHTEHGVYIADQYDQYTNEEELFSRSGNALDHDPGAGEVDDYLGWANDA